MATLRIERIKGEVFEFVEVTETVEALTDLGTHIGLATRTYLKFAKIWMSEGDIRSQVASPSAMWAVWISEGFGLVRCPRSRRTRPRRSAGEPFQNLLDLLAHLSL